MSAITAPSGPKLRAIAATGRQIASAIASWIPISVRSSHRCGASVRLTRPLPRPPSASTPPTRVTVRPMAMIPKSLGVSSRARARLPRKPISRLTTLDEVM